MGLEAIYWQHLSQNLDGTANVREVEIATPYFVEVSIHTSRWAFSWQVLEDSKQDQRLQENCTKLFFVSVCYITYIYNCITYISTLAYCMLR